MLTRRGDQHRLPAGLRKGRARALLLGVSLAVVLGACNLGGPPTGPGSASVSSSPPATQAPTSPSPTAAATSASATASIAPSLSPSPTPTPAITALCRATVLAARVTQWEGAAGHRIAHVAMTNKGKAPCLVRAISRPQLIDGIGSVVIDGSAPAGSAGVPLAPGGTLTTLVEDGNYCKATPIPPVSVAFVLAGAAGRVVAAPVSSTDVGGVPPCLGTPGSAGSIEMKPWTP